MLARTAILGALIALTLVLAPQSQAVVQYCQPPQGGIGGTSWTNPSGGAWNDPNNWSNGIPGGGCQANITLDGEYQVTVTDGQGAAALVLGGSSGKQELLIQGGHDVNNNPTDGILNVGGGDASVIGTHGVLELGPATRADGQSILLGSSTFTNHGAFTVLPGTGDRSLRNQFTNASDGTVEIGSHIYTDSHVFENAGLWKVTAGGDMLFTGTGAGPTVKITGGTWINDGVTTVSGKLEHTGGNTSGHPLQTCGQLAPAGPGTASFDFVTVPNVCNGGSIISDIGEGDTVRLVKTDVAPGPVMVGGGSFTNHGILELGGTGTNEQDQLIGGGTLTNQGTLVVTQPRDQQIQKAVVNQGTMIVGPQSSLQLNGHAITQMAGTLTVNGTLDANSGLTLSGGTLASPGSTRSVSSAFITHTGGTTTGNPLQLCGDLTPGGTGTAAIDFVQTASCSGGNIKGDISATETVRVLKSGLSGGCECIGGGSYTNHGTLELGGTAVNEQVVLTGGGTLINQGTLKITQPRDLQIQKGVDNQGTLTVGGSSSVSIGAFTQTSGTTTVTAGGAIGVNGAVTVAGGTLANSGTFDGGGNLSVTGGEATGNPPTFHNRYAFTGGKGAYSVNHGGLDSDIPEDIHLVVDDVLSLWGPGPTPSGVVNHGTIELRGTTGNPELYDHPLDNQGTITTVSGGATSRRVNVPLTNSGTIVAAHDLDIPRTVASSGTISVATGATLSVDDLTQSAGTASVAGTLASGKPVKLTGGTLTGAGTVDADVDNGGTVDPAGTLTVDGAYTQAAGGVLDADVAATTDKLHATGAATLGGTLQVRTDGDYEPPKDQQYTVLDAGTVTGTFATTAGLDSGPYDLAYGAADVRLTAKGRTTPPAPSLSIDDVSVASGAATFHVTLSEALTDPVTVAYATANGTASAPDEYRAAAGQLTFAPGETAKTVTVTVFGGRAGARTFFVDLAGAQGAAIAKARGTGTILGRLTASGVAPGSAGNGGTARLTITGAGLADGDQVALAAAGKPTLRATAVDASVDGRQLTALVDLNGAATGPRDVLVANPDGSDVQRLAGAFTVAAATAPRLTAQLTGPSKTRPMGGWFGQVLLHNDGNTDAINALIRIDGLPRGTVVSVPDAASPPVASTDGEEETVSFLAPRVGAGADTSVGVSFVYNNLAVAHKTIAAPSVMVLQSALPGLGDPTAKTTVTRETVGADGHYRLTIHRSYAGGGGDVDYDVWTTSGGPRLKQARVDYKRTGDTFTLEGEAPLRSDGCVVTGDPYASALTWNCDKSDTSLTPQCQSTPDGVLCLSAPVGAGPSRRSTIAHASSEVEHIVHYVVHGAHLAFEHHEAATAVAEAEERFKFNECLQRLGLIDPNDRKFLDDYVNAEVDWSSSKFWQGVSLFKAGTPAGVTSAATNWTLGQFVNGKYQSELSKSLYKLAREGSLATGGRNPLQDLLQNGARDLTSEGLDRELINRAELECIRLEAAEHHERHPITEELAFDPNDMSGPPGPTARHYLDGKARTYAYTAQFENLPAATAPAAKVVVTDQLDPARLDLASVVLGAVTFGSHSYAPPPGKQSFSTRVDLRPAKNLLVDVTAGLDRATGLIRWTFTSLDPVTHQPVTDADAGFLPPDKRAPEGQGSVTFTARPTAAGLRDRARTSNAASIVFDTNGAINTPAWVNVVDRSRPVARVKRVSAQVMRRGKRRLHVLVVRLASRDRGSGVAGVDVSVAEGGKRAQLAAGRTRSRTLRLTCRPRRRYRVQVSAVDRVGNRQAKPARSKPVRCR